MMPVDLDKINARVKDIREAVTKLRASGNIPLVDFLADIDRRDLACYRLIMAAEAAIGICLHLAAKVLKKAAEEYAGCFQLLSDHHLIDQGLATRLGRMARFRNLLVHQYWEINYSLVYEIITGPRLSDLEEFIRQIGDWLKKDENLGAG
ncbi:MAG: DUF86 domain-containing protein [Deltaproteobacteria bacterium]|nr:DUF86 domain-containing protein [Deltaproteobacteria bacterium]